MYLENLKVLLDLSKETDLSFKRHQTFERLASFGRSKDSKDYSKVIPILLMKLTDIQCQTVYYSDLP
jgi:hypothetical protein